MTIFLRAMAKLNKVWLHASSYGLRKAEHDTNMFVSPEKKKKDK
jgi:hypothetical protein